MSYKIVSSKGFKRDVKPLAKKYRSLKNELSDLFDSLEINPFTGQFFFRLTKIIHASTKSQESLHESGVKIL